MNLQVSIQGLQTIERLRQRKGWPKTSAVWCDYAQVSEATLKRFWRGKAIRAINFQAICEAIGVTDWEAMVDWSATCAETESFQSLQVSENHQPYIERPPIEARCIQEMQRTGALIRIKAPTKMGKTWLINHLFHQAKAQGCYTVPINLLQADEATIQDLDALLRWFCSSVSRRLNIENQVAHIWEAASSSNDNCTAYFERCILGTLKAPLVMGLENVDRIFQYPDIASDFLGLLRSWYEDAKVLETWQNLRIILAHSTEPYIQLNINQSPFNVGLPVDLPEFTADQVLQLTQSYNLDWQTDDIEKLMLLVGGHPYLIQQALQTLVSQPNMTLEQLLAIATTPAGPYRSHLRKLRQTIQQSPTLTTTLKKIVTADEPLEIECDEGFKLQSIGLIHWHRSTAMPSCSLYRSYFLECLV